MPIFVQTCLEVLDGEGGGGRAATSHSQRVTASHGQRAVTRRASSEPGSANRGQPTSQPEPSTASHNQTATAGLFRFLLLLLLLLLLLSPSLSLSLSLFLSFSQSRSRPSLFCPFLLSLPSISLPLSLAHARARGARMLESMRMRAPNLSGDQAVWVSAPALNAMYLWSRAPSQGSDSAGAAVSNRRFAQVCEEGCSGN